MSEPRPRKSTASVLGTRVTLREGAIVDARQHLCTHAKHGDIGTVVEVPRVAWPDWIHVKFDDCRMVHRLAEDEISVHQDSKS